LKELEAELGGPYRPWSTAVHDGGNEAGALAELTEFLDHHLKAVAFLARRGGWDLFMYDLMATDRIQHELWHAWEPLHAAARGRDLSKVREGFIDFWRKMDRGVGEVVDALPPDTAVLLMSDHGFGPIEHYVNFNVWLLKRGDIALQNSFYVKQKKWCYDRGVTPAALYKLMVRLGLARQRVGRFSGKQTSGIERFAESAFLSRRHIDWSRTKAYSQGNFGQIFVNVKGRQPQGCVDPEDVPGYLAELKAALRAIPNPETGEPLVEAIYERDELYHGPHAHLAPDLTVVPKDWRFRTIGLHDFTTNTVIGPAFGPTGDHRTTGVLIAHGHAFRAGAAPEGATLFDIAPTVLHLLGVPVPEDMDGRVLTEILDPSVVPMVVEREASANGAEPVGVGYSGEDEAAIQKRLVDLGYL
jgi:predicted AlkP superfamily phosphohydrolase/phosphomutase